MAWGIGKPDHSRCESIETLLRTRIGDLEAEVDRLHEMMAQERERAASREDELFNRALAATNPQALRALQSAEPAASRPAGVERIARPGSRPRVIPPLHAPQKRDYRPSAVPTAPPSTETVELADPEVDLTAAADITYRQP